MSALLSLAGERNVGTTALLFTESRVHQAIRIPSIKNTALYH